MSDARHDPATPIDDASIKLPRPAQRALARAGITTLGAAWDADDRDLLALHGMGAKAVRMLRELQPR